MNKYLFLFLMIIVVALASCNQQGGTEKLVFNDINDSKVILDSDINDIDPIITTTDSDDNSVDSDIVSIINDDDVDMLSNKSDSLDNSSDVVKMGSSINVTTEFSKSHLCNDGLDNDNDGLVDKEDPGCRKYRIAHGLEVTYAQDRPDLWKIINVTEGDLVTLAPLAEDPDGDHVSYSYYPDFISNDGTWKTTYGDAGEYLITVTASDGRLKTSKTVLIFVNPANRPPEVSCPSSISVKEGEVLKFNCSVIDKEGDSFSINYSGFKSKDGDVVGYDESGNYKQLIVVTDSDGRVVKKTINVIVEDTNRPPEVKSFKKSIVAKVGEPVVLDFDVVDPDGDKLSYTVSAPFNDKLTWTPSDDDVGTHNVKYVVSDGDSFIEKEFVLVVDHSNRPPEFNDNLDITVNEGDLITLPLNAVDPDGDKVTYEISGWFNTTTYQTGYSDSGVHKVKIVASDGKASSTVIVNILVNDKNRPPVFVSI